MAQRTARTSAVTALLTLGLLLLATPAHASMGAYAGPLPAVGGNSRLSLTSCNLLTATATLDDPAYTGRVSIIKLGGGTVASKTFTTSVSFSTTAPSAGTYATQIAIMQNGKVLSTSPYSSNITVGNCGDTAEPAPEAAPAPAPPPAEPAPPRPSVAPSSVAPPVFDPAPVVNVPGAVAPTLGPTASPSHAPSAGPTPQPSASSSPAGTPSPSASPSPRNPADVENPPADLVAQLASGGAKMPLPFGLRATTVSNNGPLGIILGAAILAVGSIGWLLLRSSKATTAPMPQVSDAETAPISANTARLLPARQDTPPARVPRSLRA